jgi:ATP-dependent helicase/DNAse subunit B
VIKLDVDYLEQAGLKGLPRGEAEVLLRYVYETLELRVGVALADRMTDRQLDEFEAYFKAKDDDGAFRWLERNFPDYKEIVAEEHEVLNAELRRAGATILALLGAEDHGAR